MGILSQTTLAQPFKKIRAVTPSDSTIIVPDIRALYVLTSGNLAVRLGQDSAPTTLPVVAGQTLPMNPSRVYATNTTATVVALT